MGSRAMVIDGRRTRTRSPTDPAVDGRRSQRTTNGGRQARPAVDGRRSRRTTGRPLTADERRDGEPPVCRQRTRHLRVGDGLAPAP